MPTHVVRQCDANYAKGLYKNKNIKSAGGIRGSHDGSRKTIII